MRASEGAPLVSFCRHCAISSPPWHESLTSLPLVVPPPVCSHCYKTCFLKCSFDDAMLLFKMFLQRKFLSFLLSKAWTALAFFFEVSSTFPPASMVLSSLHTCCSLKLCLCTLSFAENSFSSEWANFSAYSVRQGTILRKAFLNYGSQIISFRLFSALYLVNAFDFALILSLVFVTRLLSIRLSSGFQSSFQCLFPLEPSKVVLSNYYFLAE